MAYMKDSTGRRLDSFRAISADQASAANLYPRLAPPNTPAIPAVAVADDVPVITTSATPTVTGRIIAPHGGQLTEVGSRGAWSAANGRLFVSGLGTPCGLDFFLTGTTIELGVTANGNGSLPIWVWVNGAPITATPDTSTVTATGATAVYVKLVFPSSKQRHVEIFQAGGVVLNSWGGVRVPLDHLVVAAPRKPVFGFIGDSFFAGATGASSEFQSAPFLISRMLGVECVSMSFGGTGYVAAGSFTVFGSTTRRNVMVSAQPEVVVISGSVNDDAQAGVQGAAAALFSDYASALPSAKLVVFGPQPNGAVATIAAARQVRIAAVKSASDAAPNVIEFYDMVGTVASVPTAYNAGTTYNTGDRVTYLGSVWEATNGATSFTGQTPGASTRWSLVTYVLDGTGRVGAVAGDGNRDTFLYSDSVHLTVPGSSALAIYQADRIRKAIQSLATAS